MSFYFRREWASGLSCCNHNRNDLDSNHARHSAGLRDPTLLWGSRDLRVKYVKTQWLTSGEWGCLLDNGPKLVVGQPNRSFLKNQFVVWSISYSCFHEIPRNETLRLLFHCDHFDRNSISCRVINVM